MDSHDLPKRKTTKFYSNEVALPLEACGKGSNSHKKEKRNKKMWMPKPIKGKDEVFFLLEFFVLKLVVCKSYSIQ